jgi:diguanylate cyclase (GGDEF)-like protein
MDPKEPQPERRRTPVPAPGRAESQAPPAPGNANQRSGWLGRQSLRTRIALLVIGLLTLFLIAAITAVGLGSLRFARQRVADDLVFGQRVLKRVIDQDRARLAQATRVLAADFGFRDAVASNDAETIKSALANHAARIHANAAVLIDTQGRLVASTLPGLAAADAKLLDGLIADALQRDGADGVVTLAGRSMMVVVSPVLAPQPIAWVALGFDLDDGVAKQLAELTGSDVAILGRRDGQLFVRAASLDGADRDALAAALGSRSLATKPGSLNLADGEYRYLETRLDRDGRMSAALLKSLDAALEPYRQLIWELGGLLAAAFLAAALASRWVARSVSGPIGRLATAAEAIGEGNYSLELPVETADEIGRLSAGFNRMTQAVAAREAEITRFAFTDTLTGLHNRARLLREGDERLAFLAPTDPRHCMVLVLDIDRFKAVNNVLGHGVGDQVIIEVARRLRAALRDTDLVARLSGDEFAVLLYGPICEDAANVHARFEETFSNPVDLSGTPFDISVSLGIARCPEHGRDMAQLLRCAEIAMKVAKRRRSGFTEYSPAIDETRVVHLSLLSELRRAVEQDELRLYLQPKISLADGRVDSAEALVRWQHPVRGFMPPSEFIPFAEQTGRIGPLTRWVIRRALELSHRLKEAGHPLTISVNVSTQDIQDPRFPKALDALLAETGADPTSLLFEVTESGVMDNPDLALEVLAALRLRGFAISIDDFGTGQASYTYLHRMPVSELKIDRSFVRDIHRDRDAEWLVRSTIELGHNLNLSVVAEGVESVEEWHVLQKLGCDAVQGFFASPPLPVDQFLAWRSARAPFVVEPMLAAG